MTKKRDERLGSPARRVLVIAALAAAGAALGGCPRRARQDGTTSTQLSSGAEGPSSGGIDAPDAGAQGGSAR